VKPETVLGWHRALVRRKWAALSGPTAEWPAADLSRGSPADSADGARESALGLLPDPRRPCARHLEGRSYDGIGPPEAVLTPLFLFPRDSAALGSIPALRYESMTGHPKSGFNPTGGVAGETAGGTARLRTAARGWQAPGGEPVDPCLFQFRPRPMPPLLPRGA